MDKINIYLCGQKYFGQEALKMLVGLPGVNVVGVSAPVADESGRPDRLYKLCKLHGLPFMHSGGLNAMTIPKCIDLIVCAHSHDFVGLKTLRSTTFGAIGYHPSLLPLHRGRDAVIWTVRMGDKVTGGSVYWLDNNVDGGPIAAQGWCRVRVGDTPLELWKRDLQPMGVSLLAGVVKDIQNGIIVKEAQDEALASWEPSLGRPPLFRPDLSQLGSPPDGFEQRTEVNRWGAEKVEASPYTMAEIYGYY